MSWNNVIGQQRVKDLLKNSLQRGQLAHSYLFYGNDGVGEDAMAIEFAKALNCERQTGEACDECPNCINIARLQHPNLKLVFALPSPTAKDRGDDDERSGKGGDSVLAKLPKEIVEDVQEQLEQKAANPYFRIAIEKGTFIRIDSIREVIRELSLTLFSTGTRVIILFDADKINNEAANSFLKTLEEPPGSTIIILTTSRFDLLLPTIISRCQKVAFDVLKTPEIAAGLIAREGKEETQANIIAQLANGSYARALELLGEDLPARREHLLGFLRSLATKGVAEVTQESETMAKETSRLELSQYLVLMLFWFRDVFILQHGGSIINVDQKEPLQKFVQRYPAFNTEQAMGSIENTLSLIAKNGYIRLLLTTLALELRSLFQKQ